MMTLSLMMWHQITQTSENCRIGRLGWIWSLCKVQKKSQILLFMCLQTHVFIIPPNVITVQDHPCHTESIEGSITVYEDFGRRWRKSRKGSGEAHSRSGTICWMLLKWLIWYNNIHYCHTYHMADGRHIRISVFFTYNSHISGNVSWNVAFAYRLTDLWLSPHPSRLGGLFPWNQF